MGPKWANKYVTLVQLIVHARIPNLDRRSDIFYCLAPLSLCEQQCGDKKNTNSRSDVKWADKCRYLVASFTKAQTTHPTWAARDQPLTQLIRSTEYTLKINTRACGALIHSFSFSGAKPRQTRFCIAFASGQPFVEGEPHARGSPHSQRTTPPK